MKGDRLVIDRQPDLQAHLGREADVKIRLKLAFLQCFACFQPDLEELCQAFGIATPTGYWWIRNWNRQGYESLQESGGGNAGRPPLLDDFDILYLASLLKEKTCWTTLEIRDLIKTKFGIEYSRFQLARILRKRLKMHFGKPFPHDYRRPPDAEKILKERLDKVFKTLKDKGLTQEDIALGFVDETSPQNRANTVRMWSFQSSPSIVKNTDHFKSNTIGFYAIKGNSHQAFLADSTKESIQGFLGQVKQANLDYKAIVVIWDNYKSHQSSTVKEAAQSFDIYLVPLPAYSPDLNPEEFLWKSMKRELSKVFVGTEGEMKSIITKSWDALSTNLTFAKHWIEEFLTGSSCYSELCS